MRATRASFVLGAAGLVALCACSGGGAPKPSGGAPPKPVVVVQAGSCPTVTEALDGKIAGAAALEAAHQRVLVEILLRAASLPAVPGCPEGDALEQTCQARDVALAERQFLNGHQVDCVILALGPVLSTYAPTWYERPLHTTVGETVPVALGMSAKLTWAEIQRVAAHPFVERVAAAPGAVPQLGGPAPAASAECPGADADDPAPAGKLLDAAGLQAPGRHPAAITLQTDGNLPARFVCANPARCLEAVPVAWQRTILNTRQVTCIRRRLDEIVKGFAGDVAVSILDDDDGGLPPLPPFGQTPYLVEAFGFGLTGDEALLIAKHPYVRTVESLPGTGFEPPAEPTCPPDTSLPIPPRTCPVARDDAALSLKKVNPSAVPSLQQGGAPHVVIIMVSSGMKPCLFETCRDQACPAQEEIEAYRKSSSVAAQQCVRALIASVGGSATDEVFTFSESNAMVATLTWAQIEVVATHPHVLSIEANEGGPPP